MVDFCKKCGKVMLKLNRAQVYHKPCAEIARKEATARYQRSSKGKATFKRWRQSPSGKVKMRILQKRYQESMRFKRKAVYLDKDTEKLKAIVCPLWKKFTADDKERYRNTLKAIGIK